MWGGSGALILTVAAAFFSGLYFSFLKQRFWILIKRVWAAIKATRVGNFFFSDGSEISAEGSAVTVPPKKLTRQETYRQTMAAKKQAEAIKTEGLHALKSIYDLFLDENGDSVPIEPETIVAYIRKVIRKSSSALKEYLKFQDVVPPVKNASSTSPIATASSKPSFVSQKEVLEEPPRITRSNSINAGGGSGNSKHLPPPPPPPYPNPHSETGKRQRCDVSAVNDNGGVPSFGLKPTKINAHREEKQEVPFLQKLEGLFGNASTRGGRFKMN